MQNYRITPAYAGKRPHYAPLYSVMQGSPPPMRGKDFKSTVDLFYCRITPAYAGKSLSKLKGSLKRGDHPRLCGEKAKNPVRYSCKLGSPPPMRGKVFKSCCIILCSRITPAYAGKRYTPKQKKRCCQDHPRLCGEKCLVGRCPFVHDRITPAYAGKSRKWTEIQLHTWDHPRLCGEK